MTVSGEVRVALRTGVGLLGGHVQGRKSDMSGSKLYKHFDKMRLFLALAIGMAILGLYLQDMLHRICLRETALLSCTAVYDLALRLERFTIVKLYRICRPGSIRSALTTRYLQLNTKSSPLFIRRSQEK